MVAKRIKKNKPKSKSIRLTSTERKNIRTKFKKLWDEYTKTVSRYAEILDKFDKKKSGTKKKNKAQEWTREIDENGNQIKGKKL